jgi:two-component system cell cycle sensor histidine kinase PleC
MDNTINSTTEREPVDSDRRMLRAQVEMLDQSLPIMVWINPSWAVLSILPFSGIFPIFGTIAPWRLALVVLLHLCNSAVAWYFHRGYQRDPSDTDGWLHRMTALQVLVGVAWGLGVWLVWQNGNAVNNLLSILPVVAIIWVYALTRTTHTTVYLAGILTITIVTMARTLTATGATSLFLSFLVPVIFAYTLGLGLLMNRKVHAILRVRFKNEEMTHDLREAHDIALRRRFEAEAANASKTAFLANMSHELRTPLNAILGFSDMIAGQALGPIGPPRYVEYATDINSAGRHLLSLISDILDVAKIETGKMEIEPLWLDPRHAIEGAVSMMASRARDRHQQMTVTIEADAPELFADERALKQIVLNLVTNAIKFTPEGGRVSVAGRRASDGGFELCVSDTGPGIPETLIDHLFKPFARLDNRYDRNEGGTGLGLSLVRGLAELHGGRAWIESSAGKGVRAYVYFPVGNTPQEAELPRTAARA